MADPMTGRRRSPSLARRWLYLLLLAPFVGLLWPPFYAKEDPRLGDFPFFYWYQFLWVLIGVAVTALVYLSTTPRSRPRRRAPDDWRSRR
jgi:Protein of unknown function (DUF3311)